MNPTEGKANALSRLCRLGKLSELVEEYIFNCRSPTSTDPKNNQEANTKIKQKKDTQFPNLAGFCRYIGTSPDKLDTILADFPDEKEKLMAILEDEALNSTVSPTVLAAYLKKRLGYEKESRPVSEAPRQLQIQFEHNIFEDGE